MFGQLLTRYRELNDMTQKSLAEELSFHSEELRGLNAVTISRWETGTTTPGISKKREVLKFLAQRGCLREEEGCLELFSARYRRLDGRLREIFDRRYQYVVGNYPDFGIDEYRLIPLRKHEESDRHLEHLMDIERVTNAEGYYTPDLDTLGRWVEHPGCFTVICERKGRNLGHFMMIKLSSDVAREIAYHRREEFAIGPEDLRGPEERGSYYIHALYGSNPHVAALLNIRAYLHFLRYFYTIEDVVIFSTRPDGPKITRDYGIALVAEGRHERFGFPWYGMLSPVEDILFADGMIRTLFP